ncbi:MAG: hypothetical protein QW524_03980 [Candidatus Woesearchaeota archaeon]
MNSHKIFNRDFLPFDGIYQILDRRNEQQQIHKINLKTILSIGVRKSKQTTG